MNDKLRMMKKLGNLANKFIGCELYNSISETFEDPMVEFKNTGHDYRCISELTISTGQLHITFLVSHNNLDTVSVHTFNEDLFETDEENCSTCIEFPLNKLTFPFLERIVYEEIMNLFPETEEIA